MVSDIITISSNGENMETALTETVKVATYNELSPKDTLHLRLLAEEMMGMMRSITQETTGKFWIEANDGLYRLHLLVEARVDEDMRRRLLAASSSGKNEASRSLMGKLREFFFRGSDEKIAAYNNELLAEGKAPNMTDWEWSLTLYQDNLAALREKKPDAAEAWDELEKSVVRSVADDIKISIRGWDTEMIIIKKLS